MSKTARDALTECAGFLRREFGLDAADVVERWRDRNFPEAPEPAYHHWKRVDALVDRIWTDRRCQKCGLIEDFGPVVPGGRHVARYVAVDGSVTQKKHNPVPPCAAGGQVLSQINQARKANR
ncbi:hypothetical protein ADL26_04945 [Thermoactinomyces vulgaris]|nr:hypothetical protein ADL26_04945 [Thermoactinomyces vulgaris]